MRTFTAFLFVWSLASSACLAQTLLLPPRPADALTGTALITQFTPLSRDEREQAIFGYVMQGNIPDFQRMLIPVTTTANIGGLIHTATFFVIPDYLALGSNSDHFYMPMTPILAQRIANALHCTLPTRRLVDTIYARAAVKLRPQPIPPTAAMITVPVFAQHNDSVRSQRALFLPAQPLGALVGGNKKDLIISNLITQNLKTNVPKPVVIYGWHQLNGVPIQPAYNGHEQTYADYSHGTRLVLDSVLLDGSPTTFSALVTDAALNILVSDEGVIAQPYYSSTIPTPTPRSFGLIPGGASALTVIMNPAPGVIYYAYIAKYGSAFQDSLSLNASGFQIGGLQEDSLYLVRLRAFESGNASAYSEVLAATPTTLPPRLLLVHGFDRATVGNTFDFAKHHAAAFASAGERIASATNDAVVNGIVSLSQYAIADYVLGDESTADETFSAAEQETVKTFLRRGGALFVSGAEVAWDLDNKGSAADKSFINDYLKARYANDAPAGLNGTYYQAEPVGNIFSGIGSFFFDNGTHGTINVRYPDVLKAANGGSSCLQYTGLTDTVAGVSFRGMFTGGSLAGAVMFFGFPFESVYPEATRSALASRILTFLTTPTDIENSEVLMPLTTTLEQNYPNPFNPTTVVSYQLSVVSNTALRVYDVLGREVAVLVNGEQNAGRHSVVFDGSSFASGPYFYHLQTADRSLARTMILLK